LTRREPLPRSTLSLVLTPSFSEEHLCAITWKRRGQASSLSNHFSTIALRDQRLGGRFTTESVAVVRAKITGHRSKNMTIPLRALIVEDSENDCDLLLGSLARGGYEVTHKRVCSAAALRAVLEEDQWDIVISDYCMPGFKGTDALAMV